MTPEEKRAAHAKYIRQRRSAIKAGLWIPTSRTPRTEEERKQHSAAYKQAWATANRERSRQSKEAWRLRNPDKQLAASIRWQKSHPDRVLKAKRELYKSNPKLRENAYVWRKRNPEKVKQSRRKHRQKFPERHAAQSRKWVAANPEKFRAYHRRAGKKRRANRKTCSGRFTFEQFIARCNFFGWLCRYCKCELTDDSVTIDHQIPLSRGGSNWPSNLVPACASCNKRKHARTPQEYRQAIIASPANP